MNEKLLLNIFRLVIVIVSASYLIYLWYTIEEFNFILLTAVIGGLAPDLDKAIKSFSKKPVQTK